MLVVGVDTETTGLKYHKGDRIIEVCFDLYDFNPDTNTMVHVRTVSQRINPQRSISADAQRVHGISMEDLREMPTWSEYSEKVQKILERADLLVIHNAEFDQEFIWGEQQAAGRPVTRDVPVYCTMENGRWATFDGKKPSLRELAWVLGVPYDPSAAHAADYDTKVMMECWHRGVKLGFFQLDKGKTNVEP